MKDADVKSYFIKAGYSHNLNAFPYGDSEVDSETYQLDVYACARQQIITKNLRSVFDIGCGHGLKLQRYILPVCKDIVGIDWEHSINYCVQNHSFGEWYVDNVEDPCTDLGRKFDLIICSDVIEHLFNPDRLFEYIDQHAHKDTTIVLSTPERDLRRGEESMGPPENPAHVREWNKEELSLYLASMGVNVLDHQIVHLKSGMLTCQLVICNLT